MDVKYLNKLTVNGASCWFLLYGQSSTLWEGETKLYSVINYKASNFCRHAVLSNLYCRGCKQSISRCITTCRNELFAVANTLHRNTITPLKKTTYTWYLGPRARLIILRSLRFQNYVYFCATNESRFSQ